MASSLPTPSLNKLGPFHPLLNHDHRACTRTRRQHLEKLKKILTVETRSVNITTAASSYLYLNGHNRGTLYCLVRFFYLAVCRDEVSERRGHGIRGGGLVNETGGEGSSRPTTTNRSTASHRRRQHDALGGHRWCFVLKSHTTAERSSPPLCTQKLSKKPHSSQNLFHGSEVQSTLCTTGMRTEPGYHIVLRNTNVSPFTHNYAEISNKEPNVRPTLCQWVCYSSVRFERKNGRTLRSIMLLRGMNPKNVLASLTNESPTPSIKPCSPPSPTSTQPVMLSVWRPGQF